MSEQVHWFYVGFLFVHALVSRYELYVQAKGFISEMRVSKRLFYIKKDLYNLNHHRTWNVREKSLKGSFKGIQITSYGMWVFERSSLSGVQVIGIRI